MYLSFAQKSEGQGCEGQGLQRMSRRSALVLMSAFAAAGVLWPAPGSSAQSAIPMMPRKKPENLRRPLVVVLDAGHGGKDPGAIGTNETQEKDVVLHLVREMAELTELAGQGAVTVRLTRDKDVFLSLRERVEIARRAEADLFLSIHADSAQRPDARGMSAYILSKKGSDELASKLAERENLADGFGIDLGDQDQDVAAILMDLAGRHVSNTSTFVRERIVKGAGARLRLLENPSRAANFAVLKSGNIPSVLIETGFLSNIEDEKLLARPEQRQKIAGVLADEIARVLTESVFLSG
jgi:N-acetylmuramoyl-L-alanine amidase